ncbi:MULTISPECIES: hypothetical protein [unclassified Sphingomonas]|uniref:hypothetical protein n=1 Tax=unclassified Sphingomonas TaxID=196159 RepID=UPI00226A132B|nr:MULTISPECIES: hypothetical protein [unclassified Sphingomonas]
MGVATNEDQLIWKALVALDEVCHRAHEGAIQPTFALRFVLAFLFSRSDGDRRSYDMFWKECRDPRHGQTQADYCRGTYTRTAWNGIVPSLGIPQTIDFMTKVAEVRRGKRKVD